MKFGIITPVFDGCLDSLELLFSDIKSQSYRNWAWTMCSNGHSDKIKEFVREKNRILARDLRNVARSFIRMSYPQIIYSSMVFEEVSDSYDLLANVGKRRDMCLRNVDADYIFMIDADAKLLNNKMFSIINSELSKNPRSICVYKINHEVGVLPIFPIDYGRIDMLNFCIRADVAREVGYPTTVNREKVGNDYWYFDRAYKYTVGDMLFIDKIFGQHNGNNTYTNLLKLL